ncbi:MAG: PD40 domain-containing protein [Gemmatimonadaceae bacterium]|nr:PD40 domain-containing protein [Gemmatimonadaceae bacterium]
MAFIRGDSLLVHDGGVGTDLLVTVAGDLHSCDWSIDDRWFACVQGNAVAVTPGARFGNVAPSSIVLVAAAGGAPVRLSLAGGSASSPVWHPDGRRLLFLANRLGSWDVYAQAIGSNGVSEGEPERLTTALDAQTISLSGDASRLVYSAYQARANVWSIPIPDGPPVNASGAVRLTSGNQLIEAVSVSPTGTWLVYDSNIAGSPNLYRIPATGGEPEALTSDSTQEFRGDLSPSETELAFQSYRTGSRDVFVMPVGGGSVRQVTRSPLHEAYPIWSPDGSAIAFFTIVPRDVYVVKRARDGQWGAPVLRTAGVLPHWSPDGQSLCFRDDRTSGIGIVGAYSGTPRVVYQPIPGSDDPHSEFALFARTGRELYFKSHDRRGMASIWSVPITGGRPRLLVKFDDPARQSNWAEIATDHKRFYFTIDESQSDLHLATLVSR